MILSGIGLLLICGQICYLTHDLMHLLLLRNLAFGSSSSFRVSARRVIFLGASSYLRHKIFFYSDLTGMWLFIGLPGKVFYLGVFAPWDAFLHILLR